MTKRIGFACKWIDHPHQIDGIGPKDECRKYNTGATTVAQTTTTSPVKPPVAPTSPVKPAADVAATTVPTTPSTPVPGADMVASLDQPIVPKDTKLLSSPPPGVNFKDVFDMPAYLKTPASGREDMTKFIKPTPAGQAYKKSLSERYELFKKQNNNQLN